MCYLPQIGICLSLICYQEEKNNALILEQLITQLAINRDALNADRQAIGKLIESNKKLLQDLSELKSKISILENKLKPVSEEEASNAKIDNFTNKLLKYLLRELETDLLFSVVIVFGDGQSSTIKNKFAAALAVKLKGNTNLRSLNQADNDIIQKTPNKFDGLDILKRNNVDALAILVIEEDPEDSFCDIFFPAPVIEHLPKAPAPAPVPAPAPAQTPSSYRLFKR
jgi:hypothetical protein